jgi:hypothetical protein
VIRRTLTKREKEKERKKERKREREEAGASSPRRREMAGLRVDSSNGGAAALVYSNNVVRGLLAAVAADVLAQVAVVTAVT